MTWSGTNLYIQKQNRRFLLFLIVLIITAILAFVLSLSLGSVKIPFNDVVSILIGQPAEKSTWTNIIFKFRLPKAITALLAGAALAVSGLEMQTLFRNPLADPFVLGISSGASLGVAIVIMLVGTTGSILMAGIGLFGDLSIAIAASIGASLVLFVVLLISHRARSSTTMLLVGLMVSYVTSSIVSLLIYFSMPERIHTYLTWTFGSFAGVTWSQLRILLPIILSGLFITFTLPKPLNAYLLGEAYAQSLGVNIKLTRTLIIISSSILTGVVTAFCGTIGFIGIAIPHVCRGLLNSSDHRRLIPAAILLGGISTLIADIIAQMPGTQQTLPINVVTSLIGAPIVIWILIRKQMQKG